jgi:predicted transposase YdaD
MEKAVQAYHQITTDSQFRELERLREIARHNEASALRYERNEGRKEGIEEVARVALAQGMSIETIHAITGLSMEPIQLLSK